MSNLGMKSSAQNGWRRCHVFLLASVFVSLCGCTHRSKQDCQDSSNLPDVGDGYYSGGSVASPFGRMILVKRGGVECAVKFVHWCRGNDSRPATWFTNGDESIQEQYIVYRWNRAVNSWSQTPGVVSQKASVGLGFHGRPAPDSGRDFLECGDLRVRWAFPHALLFQTWTQTGFRYDSELQLAATGSTDPAQIDFQNPSIRWFTDGERLYPRKPLKVFD